MKMDPVVLDCDVVIAGGSLGGIAAALAALESGASVILTEENAWIGGQVTSQAVSALDEYDQVERLPPTHSYAAFRSAIRQRYQTMYQAPGCMPDGAPLNPGNAWVSRLCFEPRVGLSVLAELLEPFIRQGRLQIFRRHTLVRCAGDPTHLTGVELASPRRQPVTLHGSYYLDATDLGDLLPLAGVPYVTGAEAREETGEPHASPDGPHPQRVQSFTYCFLVEFRPGENHTIRKPSGYARFKQFQPYSLTITNHLGQPVEYPFFTATAAHPLPFWAYRRVFDAHLLDPTGKRNDIALINWPSNDYRWGNLIDQPPRSQAGDFR